MVIMQAMKLLAGNWVVRIESARARPWQSQPMSFFEARRVAKRAAAERGQVARIHAVAGRAAINGRRSKQNAVEVYYPDGRVERPGGV